MADDHTNRLTGDKNAGRIGYDTGMAIAGEPYESKKGIQFTTENKHEFQNHPEGMPTTVAPRTMFYSYICSKCHTQATTFEAASLVGQIPQHAIAEMENHPCETHPRETISN